MIGAAPLWTDEAESSVNALSILSHGVPVGEYAGVPVFENAFSQPWPEHPEFEFRDTSYSDSGLAVYHGWLPLYAIAASFLAHGITPVAASEPFTVRHTREELPRMTRAARLPSILFGVVFLLGMFLAGRELYGTDAGWAALAAGCVSTTAVTLTRQARYYSLTLALTALVAWMFGRLLTRGTRKDFAWAGGLLALLFHTNVLSFLSACGALVLLLPALWRRGRQLSHLVVLGAIVVAGVVPWVLATGYLTAASAHPMARDLLRASEILAYPAHRRFFVAVALGTLAWTIVVRFRGARLPARAVRPFRQVWWEFFFLTGWVVIAFAAFTALIPAASHFHSRLTLVILVPSLLFGALLSAALARVALRHSAVAAVLFVVFLSSSGKATLWWPSVEPWYPAIYQVVDHLREAPIRPGTLLYADTGVSLILRFYSGLPVRSVLPVRREFLERHPGEMLVVESPHTESLSWMEVKEILDSAGQPVSEAEARMTARWLNDYVIRRELEGRGVSVSPPPPPYPGVPVLARLTSLLDAQSSKTRRAIDETVRQSGNPMFRGYEIRSYTELWQLFFYRFVDPASRMGPLLNYAPRVAGSEATLLPRGWAVLRVPAREPCPEAQAAAPCAGRPERPDTPALSW